jgi:hypothetical protein
VDGCSNQSEGHQSSLTVCFWFFASPNAVGKLVDLFEDGITDREGDCLRLIFCLPDKLQDSIFVHDWPDPKILFERCVGEREVAKELGIGSIDIKPVRPG